MGGGAGQGGGSTLTEGQAPPSGPDLTTCAKGSIWSKKKHSCLVHRTGLFTDDELTEYAFSLAKAQRYDEAIELLDGLQNADTPKAWNYRGYATRKLGKTEEGIGYYLKSVALDPNYTEVREYLGEAYVIQGKLDLAKDQLQTIERLCGNRTCEEYEELSGAIDHTRSF